MEVTHLGISFSRSSMEKGSLESNSVNSTESSENEGSFSTSDSYEAYKFSMLSSPVKLDEIIGYFEKSNTEKIRQTIEDLKGELKSREETDRLIMVKLFSLDEQDQEKELRRLLQELDQTDELERILFGGARGVDEEVHKDATFELNFNLDTIIQRLAQRDAQEKQLAEREANLSQSMEIDPLVLDLSGNGIKTTGIDQGIFFDMDGDKDLELTSFVSGDDYLLALDKNNNKKIDSGKELFGQANGFNDGILELQSYDANNDGFINALDPVFAELVLINDSGALTISEAGVSEISLKRQPVKGFFINGDRYEGGLEFKLSDGKKRQALDVYFQLREQGKK